MRILRILTDEEKNSPTYVGTRETHNTNTKERKTRTYMYVECTLLECSLTVTMNYYLDYISVRIFKVKMYIFIIHRSDGLILFLIIEERFKFLLINQQLIGTFQDECLELRYRNEPFPQIPQSVTHPQKINVNTSSNIFVFFW